MSDGLRDSIYRSTNDMVNHPSHYTSGGIEVIDYMKAKMTKEQFEGYLIGNVIKYVSRFQQKNGVEDLLKSQWYLNKLIAEIKGQREEREKSKKVRYEQNAEKLFIDTPNFPQDDYDDERG